jgi:hypothetical protein
MPETDDVMCTRVTVFLQWSVGPTDFPNLDVTYHSFYGDNMGFGHKGHTCEGGAGICNSAGSTLRGSSKAQVWEVWGSGWQSSHTDSRGPRVSAGHSGSEELGTLMGAAPKKWPARCLEQRVVPGEGQPDTGSQSTAL